MLQNILFSSERYSCTHTEGASYHNQNQFSKISWKQAHCILQNTSFVSFWPSNWGSWCKQRKQWWQVMVPLRVIWHWGGLSHQTGASAHQPLQKGSASQGMHRTAQKKMVRAKKGFLFPLQQWFSWMACTHFQIIYKLSCCSLLGLPASHTLQLLSHHFTALEGTFFTTKLFRKFMKQKLHYYHPWWRQYVDTGIFYLKLFSTKFKLATLWDTTQKMD